MGTKQNLLTGDLSRLWEYTRVTIRHHKQLRRLCKTCYWLFSGGVKDREVHRPKMIELGQIWGCRRKKGIKSIGQLQAGC